MAKKFKSKKTMKKKTAIIIVAVAMLAVGVLGFLSNGFTNSDVGSWVRERNPDNIFDYKMPVEDYETEAGAVVNVAEDGTIRVTGEIEKDNQLTYDLGAYELEAGEYTLTASKKSDKNTFIVTGTYTNASGEIVTWYSDLSKTKTVTFEADTVVTFALNVYEDGDVNITVRPVLNEGDEAIDFYVAKTIGGK